MDWTTGVRFVAGLVLLVAGAEGLVRGASRLAAAAGISPLVIGLTVVAMGTGSPELAVSVRAALSGEADIAVGNVVGSNILNVLFVLGVSALVAPIAVSRRLIAFDTPVMIGASAALWLMARDGALGRWEGLLLLAAMVAYTVGLLRRSQRNGSSGDDAGLAEGEIPAGGGPRWVQVLWVVGGLGLLVIGAGLLVDAAVTFAARMGVSELVISLTIVAVGTSLPEVATSVIAAFRGERDIAVGNVVGSNTFNILAVLGLSALASPQGLIVSPMAVRVDLPVMLGVAVVCLPIFFSDWRVARGEGAIFFGFYVAYTLYLYFRAVGHDALGVFSQAMGLVVIPLVTIGILLVAMRTARRERRAVAGEPAEAADRES